MKVTAGTELALKGTIQDPQPVPVAATVTGKVVDPDVDWVGSSASAVTLPVALPPPGVVIVAGWPT